MSGPLHLLENWDAVSPRLSRPDRVGLFLDFDGTLAAIRRRPADVHLAVPTRRLLSACSRRLALMGIVSGRRLSEVRRLVGVGGIWYAGVHGYFLRSPENHRFALLNRDDSLKVTRFGRRLRGVLASEAGIVVESKGAGLAVHYRGAPARSVRRAEHALQSLLAGRSGLRIVKGRKIWEILPAGSPTGSVDKWSAIRFIARHSPRRPRTLVFLGDDTGDECVFARMRGISVLVGRRRRTAARYWLRSPVEVRQFLELCLRLWK